MAERRAASKYYPPDWEPKHGSLNTFHGQHPLRERARKLDQGVLVVRFELPHSATCVSCGVHIGQGTRFNAEKKKIGAYFTSPIWSFRFKCTSCPQTCVVQTDPAAAEYVYHEGLQRRTSGGWAADAAAHARRAREDGIQILEVADSAAAVSGDAAAVDPMEKLEKLQVDKERAGKEAKRIAELQDINLRNRDDYVTLRQARGRLRAAKNAALELEAQAFLSPIGQVLEPTTAEDEGEVAAVAFRRPLRRLRRRSLARVRGSVFSSSSLSSSSNPASSLLRHRAASAAAKPRMRTNAVLQSDPAPGDATAPGNARVGPQLSGVIPAYSSDSASDGGDTVESSIGTTSAS